jgi:hypothetical protein
MRAGAGARLDREETRPSRLRHSERLRRQCRRAVATCRRWQHPRQCLSAAEATLN